MEKVLADIFMSRNLNNIQRYSLVRTNKDQSVAEHSFGVAVLSSLILKDLKNYFPQYFLFLTNNSCSSCIWNLSELYILKSSLYHDLGEAVTGDVTYPFKHSKHFSDSGERDYIKSQFEDGLFSDELPLLLDFSDELKLGRLSYFFSLLPDEIQESTDREQFSPFLHQLDGITKFCDCLELLIYTYEEIKSGNTFIEPIWKEGTKILNSERFRFIIDNSILAQVILKSLSLN